MIKMIKEIHLNIKYIFYHFFMIEFNKFISYTNFLNAH